MQAVSLNHKSFGETGNTLVILHGLFGCLDNWQTLARRWSDRHSVMTLDLRNHGRSPHHPESGYAEMVADLEEFFRCHAIERANVLGHSLGGKVAMAFASKNPDLVAKLIVVDIAPKAYGHALLPIFDALATVTLEGTTRREDVARQLAKHIDDPATRNFLLKNLHRDKGKLTWKMNLPALRAAYTSLDDAPALPAAFTGPTLFVRGTRSSYILKEDRPIILRHFPRASFADIPCGHWVHAEAPDAFSGAVLGFLEE